MRKNTWQTMSDEVILQTLGERLARYRLDRNLTQEAVAHEAGVARRTVSRAENGHPVDTQNLIRILRALGLLERLDDFLPERRPSPLALAEGRGRQRARARSDDEAVSEAGGEWRWPDEEGA